MSDTPRFETYVEDGTIYVGSPDGPLAVGSVDAVIELLGGPSWMISYSDAVVDRHPELDTEDAGLTVDIVDMIHAMTHSQRFVETLAAQPATARPTTDDAAGPAGSPGNSGAKDTSAADATVEVSPRLGLFVGKLLENLESGID
ncbi:hypothetical protein BRC62_04880 [Halobacteriales archaeon QH_10_67_13]|nr:MAG: hypothetical protein BRC62_04880 [Halobacteriales archaeon QH_10_67_13]